MSEYPPIQPNGSLILAWQVKNRHVLVIGGGEVAASRIYHLLNANAKITVISPSINEEIQHRQSSNLLHSVILRQFEESDLSMYSNLITKPKLVNYTDDEYQLMDEYLQQTQFALVLVAIDDPVESKKIYYQCKSKGFNVNIADVPPLCDFYFGSIFRKGDLQIMVSTNGKGPRMARLIKDKIGDLFHDYEIDKTITNIGTLRQLLRKRLNGNDTETIKQRMEWMTSVTDLYTFKQWSSFTNDDLLKILDYFPNQPLKFEELSI